MPALDTERRAATRSALRYRPIDTEQDVPAPIIPRARRLRPDAHVTTAPVAPDEADLDEEERAPRRSSRAPVPRRQALPARTRRRVHPLLFVGLGLVVTMLLWIGISQAVSWGTNEYNNVVYGFPRTFQVDQVVGQGDSPQRPSHFLEVKWDHFLNCFAFVPVFLIQRREKETR